MFKFRLQFRSLGSQIGLLNKHKTRFVSCTFDFNLRPNSSRIDSAFHLLFGMR